MPLPIKGLLYENLTGQHHQCPGDQMRRPPCADLELNLAECLEAYGVNKGYDRCWMYMEDYRECIGKGLTNARHSYMKYIRAKKIASGEIPWNDRFSKPPPYDSFIQGTFYP